MTLEARALGFEGKRQFWRERAVRIEMRALRKETKKKIIGDEFFNFVFFFVV